jgi:hypothetical protein
MAFFRVAGERIASAARRPAAEHKPFQHMAPPPSVPPKKVNGSAVEHNFTRF